MYSSTSLHCVHGVGISRAKSTSSIADLISATLLMPGKKWSSCPLCMSHKEKAASLTLVKNTNGYLVHFLLLPLNASHSWGGDTPFVDFEISDII